MDDKIDWNYTTSQHWWSELNNSLKTKYLQDIKLEDITDNIILELWENYGNNL